MSSTLLPPINGSAVKVSMKEKNRCGNDSEEDDSELQTSDAEEASKEEYKVASLDATGYKQESIPVDSSDQYLRSSFSATFNDGSTFKNLIDYLRRNNPIAFWRFGSDYIKYSQTDATRICFNSVTIDVSDIESYTYNSEIEEIIIGISLDRFLENMVSVGKKDGIKIYKESGDNSIFIQIQRCKNENSRNLTKVEQISTNECKILTPPPYDRSDRNPNLSIVVSDFCGECSSLIPLKIKTASFHCYHNGLSIVPESAKSTHKTCSFGKVPDLDDNDANGEEIITTIVPIHIIKLWKKLKNLAGNSTIKFFFQSNLPLRMDCRIGSFGRLQICVQSIQQ